MKLNLVLVILAVAMLIFVAGATGYFIFSKNPGTQTVLVTKVIDGDTIDLETGERVRLLGINTPEKNAFYYEESKDRLIELLGDKQVRLEEDGEDKDRYGRLLRHVFVSDNFVNLQMVREGYATVYLLYPGDRYYEELKDAEEEAKANKIGLWSAVERSCIEVSFLNYDAAGNDNENLNDEYATFRNVCDNTVSLSSWTVKDEGKNIYTFGKFALEGEAEITLHSGKGTDGNGALYWGSGIAIWNNAGDTLFLRNEKGSLVLSYSYP